MHPSPTFIDSQNSSFKYLWDLIRTENDGLLQWGNRAVFSRDEGGGRGSGQGKET